MADREKVIRGLEHCSKADCEGCPYEHDLHLGRWVSELVKDALELLKGQEPVKPKEERLNDVDSIYRCGNCGTHFYYRQQKYCAICGRMAKWDDR